MKQIAMAMVLLWDKEGVGSDGLQRADVAENRTTPITNVVRKTISDFSLLLPRRCTNACGVI